MKMQVGVIYCSSPFPTITTRAPSKYDEPSTNRSNTPLLRMKKVQYTFFYSFYRFVKVRLLHCILPYAYKNLEKQAWILSLQYSQNEYLCSVFSA